MRCRTIVLGAAIAAALVPGVASAQQIAPHALGDVAFRFDSAALPDDAASTLCGAAGFAAANPTARIVLDAHTDPRGSSAYNVALAIRRADSVRRQLIASGVPGEQIVFAIYGADGVRRPTFSGDRRVSLWASREPMAAIIDQTLSAGGAAVTWQRPLTVAQIDAAPAPVASR